MLNIKLYLMEGLPTETDETSKRWSRSSRVLKTDAEAESVSVVPEKSFRRLNGFVPKPNTPFSGSRSAKKKELKRPTEWSEQDAGAHPEYGSSVMSARIAHEQALFSWVIAPARALSKR